MYTFATSVTFINPPLAPYGPDSSVLLCDIPRHDTSPPLPRKRLRFSREHPRVHYITHKFTTYIVLYVILGAAHYDPTTLFSSSAPFAGPCLRASCLLQALCATLSLCFPPQILVASPKSMEVKAGGWMQREPLVNASDSESCRVRREISPLLSK